MSSRFGMQATVFDSKSEEAVFHALESQWSPRFKIFPQLPLSKLFGSPPDDATAQQRDFFWKTNVDYTVCDHHNAPIASVEFDGVGGGFNKEGQYVAARAVENDPYRSKKLDFKLRLARETGYPFFVVSYDETRPVERGESLTILDGVLATVLTHRHAHELMQELIRDHRQRFGEPDDEDIQTIAIDAGTLAELDIDPFEREASRLEFDLSHRYGLLRSVDVKQYSVPPVPDATGEWMSPEYFRSLTARIDSFKAADRHGAKVIVSLRGDHPVVMRNISIRAVGDWSGALMLAKKIARYLALKHAFELLTPAELSMDRISNPRPS